MALRLTLPFAVVPVGNGYYDAKIQTYVYDQFDIVIGGNLKLPAVKIDISDRGNLDLSDEQIGRIERRLFTLAQEELLTAVLSETVRVQTVRDDPRINTGLVGS